MENIVCFSLPSFFRLFSKENRSLDVSLQSQLKKLQNRKPEYVKVSTMFERDLPNTICYNWGAKLYFWGSKGLTDWNSSRPKQFFLKYTSPVRNISTYLLLKREQLYFLFLFQFSVTKLNVVSFLLIQYGVLNCYKGILLMFYKHVPCCIINQSFSSCNENDRRCF